MRKGHKVNRDKRLQDIAHILARGILRMKDNGLLLTNGLNESDSILQKPLKPVNQRVSG